MAVRRGNTEIEGQGSQMTVTINSSTIDAIKQQIMDKVEIGCQQGALVVNSNHINPKTPVDTGNLRSHNDFTITRADTTVTTSFFNETPYDLPVNDGTSRRPGVHYREIGVHEGLPDFIERIQENVKT
jgi:hypothetical protein